MVKNKRGFTIVEIMIVVIVIAILVTLTIVTYNGMKRRAEDAKRVSDLTSLVKAIQIYKHRNGAFPTINTPYAMTHGGWDSSAKAPTTFLSALVPDETQVIPLDPVNDDGMNGGRFGYRYYVYDAGSSGCDATKGRYFVLVGRTDNNAKKLEGHEGFSCPLRDWSGEGSWVVGGFEKPWF